METWRLSKRWRGRGEQEVVCALFLIGTSPTPALLLYSDVIILRLAIHMLAIRKDRVRGQDKRRDEV